MDPIKEMLIKAKEVEEDEDESLTNLLGEMGIQDPDDFLLYIKQVQDSIDDQLQDDYEDIEVIVVGIMTDFKKMPSKRKLKKLLSERDFVSKFHEEVNTILKDVYIDSIDKISKQNDFIFDFDDLSKQVTDQLDKWLDKLPDLMKLTTDKAVEKLLRKAFMEGKGIDWLKARLAELPEFSYNRAKTTAITESLRMYSAGGYESLLQNDAVAAVRWRHTLGIKEPRHSHELLDGQVVPKGEYFIIDGEKALYPRDPKLSAKQSIYCHCWAEPVLREEYLKGGEIKKWQDNSKMSQSHTFHLLIKQQIRKSFSLLNQQINRILKKKSEQ